MEYQKQELTIDKLNQAYIKLIKMVLNRTYQASSPHINSFYHDPTPEEAFAILNRIFSHQQVPKKDAFDNEFNNQSSQKKFQLKRAQTTTDEREPEYKTNSNFYNEINELSNGVKINTPTKTINKTYSTELDIQAKNNQFEAQSKTDRLKRLTAKITQIFSNNHKKILKYQQKSKYPIASNQPKYALPMEIGFKKY